MSVCVIISPALIEQWCIKVPVINYTLCLSRLLWMRVTCSFPVSVPVTYRQPTQSWRRVQLKSHPFVCVPLSPPPQPPAICVYCNGTNHSLPARCVCVCVCWLVMALTHVALFVHRLDCFLALPVQTAPHYHSLWCVCVCVRRRGTSGLCLLDIGGPCTPMVALDKDCCLRSHKSSLSLSLSNFVSPRRPPPFLTRSRRLVNGVRVRARVRADTSQCLWPLASIQSAHDHWGEWGEKNFQAN